MKKFKKGERFKIYTNYLNREPNITIKSFLVNATSEGIPEITARRDLKLLENLNYIVIEFGLVKYNPTKAWETTREEKSLDNLTEKNIIGKVALEQLNTSSVFVGPGTTCEAFVRQINKPIEYLFTNGFEIAKIAELNESIHRVVVIGGKLRPQSGAMCGPIAVKAIEDLHFDQTFITITNINDELDLFNNNAEEAYLTALIIKNSNNVVCLIDHTKFDDVVKGNKICNASDINIFITDKEPNKVWLDKFKINSEIKW